MTRYKLCISNGIFFLQKNLSLFNSSIQPEPESLEGTRVSLIKRELSIYYCFSAALCCAPSLLSNCANGKDTLFLVCQCHREENNNLLSFLQLIINSFLLLAQKVFVLVSKTKLPVTFKNNRIPYHIA